LIRHSTALSYFGAYFSANVAIAVSAVARSGASQISRRSLCALDFLPAVKHREFRLQALEPDVF
jgi:hypothetical protein